MAVALRPAYDAPQRDIADELARALDSRYKVVRPLAAGAMASVFLGWEYALARHVAIKVMHPWFDGVDDRERFRREAQILARLTHPNIVPVYAFGVASGLTFAVMRYIPGETLGARLERERTLPTSAVRYILASLADAADTAHKVGVVHRDIKPQNILMDTETGRPTLIDFGVAVLRTSEHSRSEIRKSWGTPQFMSPEHVLGDPSCDGRSDIYALGILGFRMLTGKLPFAGSDEAVAARQVATAAPVLRECAPHIAPDLADIIQRCLAKDPADRWPDGAALRQALLRSGAAKGVIGRWVRRILRGSSRR